MRTTDGPKLSTEIAPRHSVGLKLVNPVMIASGTFGWGWLRQRPSEKWGSYP